MSDHDLDKRAVESLGNAGYHLGLMANSAFGGEQERVAAAAGDAAAWDTARFGRMLELCGKAHLSVENALKAYTAGATRTTPAREHRIDKLLDAIPAVEAQLIESAMAPLTSEDLNPWRAAATYVGEEEAHAALARVTPQFASGMYGAALAVCEHVASRLQTRLGPAAAVKEKAQQLLGTVSQARSGGYAQKVLQEPAFAVSTYSAMGMSPPAHAIPEPLMPSRRNPLRALRSAGTKIKQFFAPKRQQRPERPAETAISDQIQDLAVSSKGKARPCAHEIDGGFCGHNVGPDVERCPAGHRPVR